MAEERSERGYLLEATARSILGLLFFLLALGFYYLAVLRIDYQKTALLDLRPQPDAAEYFAQAKSLLEEGWPSVQIGYDKLPSRYPVGYPILMLPWLKILPTADAVLAPLRTSQTLGLLLLLAVFGFYAYLAMPLTGGFATLLLATLPGFFTFCRSSFSEISAAAFIVPAFMFAYLGLKEERRWKIYLAAVLLGLSVNIRIQSLFFAPVLLAMALLPMRGMRLRWLLHCTALPLVFVLAASPVLILNTVEFHSPFKTGYHFWVPYLSEKHLNFTLHYIPRNILFLWNEFSLGPNGFFASNIFGTGTHFVPPFILLVCAGFAFVPMSRFVVCAFLAALSFFAVTVSYMYGQDARFYVPLLILLVAIGVLPVTWATRNIFAKRQLLAVLGILALTAAACLGYPSHSGYKKIATTRSQLWDALRFTKLPRQSNAFIAQEHFVKLFGQQPGIVLSDIDPVYLNALLPDPFVAAPLDEKHHYMWSTQWRYDRPQALALVKRGLEQSLPVYALFISQEEMATKQSRLPAVPGYEWHLLNDSDSKPAILNLIPAAPHESEPSD